MTTRVYVGRLSRDVRERDLERLFRNFGEIREVLLKNGYGFVEFRDWKDAEDVVREFHGRDFMGDRRRFGPPVRTQYRVVVENISSSVSWQDLKDFCRQAGEVTYTDVHGREGIVEFASYDDMKNAIRKLDDTELRGRRDSRGGRSRSRSPGYRRRSGDHRRSRSRDRRGSSRDRRSRSRERNGKDERSTSRRRDEVSEGEDATREPIEENEG